MTGYESKKHMAQDKLDSMKDEALKLALEALQFDGNIWHMDCKKDEAITAVALVIDGVLVKSALPEKYTGHLYTTPPQRPEERNFCPRCGKRTQDIHTCTPPQRTWVYLTDEHIKEIVGPWGDTPIKGYTRKLVDQIEAKLKELNA